MQNKGISTEELVEAMDGTEEEKQYRKDFLFSVYTAKKQIRNRFEELKRK